MKITATCFLFLNFLIVSAAQAEVNFLPENAYRDPTTSSTIFEDPFTGIYVRSGGRTLGNVTVSVPLVAWDKDQIFIQTGVESTLRIEGPTFYSETLDLRVGINWTHPLAEHLWLSVGIEHMSGHVMDDLNASESELIPLDVGIDGFPIRLVDEVTPNWRVGVHTFFAMGTDPTSRTVTGGPFIEYRPFATNYEKSGLFLATNIYYAENLNLGISTNEQIGYTYHRGSILAGYHSGADTRLKQQLYLNSTANFWYTGINFEI